MTIELISPSLSSLFPLRGEERWMFRAAKRNILTRQGNKGSCGALRLKCCASRVIRAKNSYRAPEVLFRTGKAENWYHWGIAA
jgi:hypothetical protein